MNFSTRILLRILTLLCAPVGMSLTANCLTGAPKGSRKRFSGCVRRESTCGQHSKTQPWTRRQRFERDYVDPLSMLTSSGWSRRSGLIAIRSFMPTQSIRTFTSPGTYAPLDQRLRAYTDYARAVPTALEQIRKNLRTPLPKTYVQHWSYDLRWPGFFLRKGRACEFSLR